MKIQRSLLSWVAALAALHAFFPTASFAQEENQERPGPRITVTFEPRFYLLKAANFSGAFSNNGFETPSRGRFGMGIQVHWLSDDRWQIGFGVGSFGARDEKGNSDATANQAYVGFDVAKNLSGGDDWDFTLGGLAGFGFSQTEILSTAQNGRFSDSGFVLEPRIGMAFRISPWFKIGPSAGYLFQFKWATESKGDNLALSRSSSDGWLFGLQVIIGHFGREG